MIKISDIKDELAPVFDDISNTVDELNKLPEYNAEAEELVRGVMGSMKSCIKILEQMTKISIPD